MPAADIDLDRGHDQPGHLQSRVALSPHRHEIVFAHTLVDVDVSGALGEHGGFPDEVIAVGRLVIVAQEHSGLVWQRHQTADRAVEQTRIAAGEIRACGAVIGHEHGVAGEHRIADDIGHVGRRVARDMERNQRDIADRQRVAVDKQAIELRAVAGEASALVEDLAEDVLDGDDIGTDDELPT